MPIKIPVKVEISQKEKIETPNKGIERKNAIIADKKQYNNIQNNDSSWRIIIKLVKDRVIKLDKKGGMTIIIVSNEEKILKLGFLKK